MQENTDKVSPAEIFQLYIAASLKHRKRALLSLLQPLGAICFGVAVPFAASAVLATLAQGKNVQTPLLLLVIASAAGVILNRTGFVAAMKLQAHTMSDLHQRVFNRLMQRSVGYHADRVSGKLISDAIDFINSYGMLMTATFLNGLGFVLSMLVGVVILLVVSWPLGVVVTIIVTITLVWAWLESRTRSELRATRLIATKKLTSHLSDSIVNAVTVKTFAREELERERNVSLNVALRDLRVRDWRRAGVSGANRIAALLGMQVILLMFIVYLTKRDP